MDQPNFNFVPSGKANGGKPTYEMAMWDIAPRLGVAYAFNNKTSIRAGSGELRQLRPADRAATGNAGLDRSAGLGVHAGRLGFNWRGTSVHRAA